MDSVTAKRSSHLHLPICAAAACSPGGLQAPHCTPNPHRAHLGVGCGCTRTAYTPSTSHDPKLPNGAHSLAALRMPRSPRGLSPDPKGRGLLPATSQLRPTLRPLRRAARWVHLPFPPSFHCAGVLHSSQGSAGFSQHAPNGKTGFQAPLPEANPGRSVLGRCPPLLNSDLL